MIAICKIEKEISFTYDEVYLIYGGNYLIDDEGNKHIIEILTQDDNGSLVFVSASSFMISALNFEKYIVKKDSFAVKCIGYNDFLANYHEDCPDKVEYYKKAQSDFFKAKLELYEELSDEMLERKLVRASQEEQDFIFDYLCAKKNDNYIIWAVGEIRNAMNENKKWYEVHKKFEYLASFKNEMVRDFFTDYLLQDYWGNDLINNIIYNYLG